jgi:hypothetical protein
MAFLDNSGDIILDATLTELGRQRMANGTFTISKFAFGDDEINYRLYNKDHSSGSAYYDLEIMQTPIFEASTGGNASINYGLTSLSNNNLLYMPTIKRNQLVRPGAKPVSNVYYLAVNDATTADALVTAFGGESGGGDLKVLRSSKADGTAILLETGLDTTEISATPANKSTFITSNGLAEASFLVSVDRRFISAVMGPSSTTVFNNNGSSGESNVVVSLISVPAVTRDNQYMNNNTATITAINNNVVKRLTDNKSDTATSVISGPRASFTAINFETKLLTADDYSRYGKTGQSIAGAAGTYRFIDTTVRVVGTTGITEQLPIRIIQKE